MFKNSLLSFLHRARDPVFHVADKSLVAEVHVVEHVFHGFAVNHLVDVVAAVVVADNVYGIRIAKEVVEVTENFLVCTDEVNCDKVRLVLLDRVERNGASHFATANEHVNLAIAIASHVLNRRLDRRLFVQTLDRHNREHLIHAPAVREALEKAEVAEVLFGKQTRKFAQFIRRMAQVASELVHLAGDAPEP